MRFTVGALHIRFPFAKPDVSVINNDRRHGRSDFHQRGRFQERYLRVARYELITERDIKTTRSVSGEFPGSDVILGRFSEQLWPGFSHSLNHRFSVGRKPYADVAQNMRRACNLWVDWIGMLNHAR